MLCGVSVRKATKNGLEEREREGRTKIRSIYKGKEDGRQKRGLYQVHGYWSRNPQRRKEEDEETRGIKGQNKKRVEGGG